MFTQFVENLVHFECRDNGLDQHRPFDRALWHAKLILRHDENIVPQARLKMRFHFWQVKIHAAAARQQGLYVVKKIHREIENCAGDNFAVKRDVFFVKVPAAWARKQHGGFVIEFVVFAVLLEGNCAQISVAQVKLPLDHVLPGRTIGVFEIGHKGTGTAVERVDDHLAISRTGDLDTAILDVRRNRRHNPLSNANVFGFV